MKSKIEVWLFVIIALVGCNDEVATNGNGNGSNSGNNSNQWLVSKNEVRDGGPGKDGIPALTDPNFIEASDADYGNETLVIGVSSGNVAKAYPHDILDWHEIINDSLANVHYAITYCPLTGTGISWDRMVNNRITTFGVSGLLYNTNLIPYDRATGSNWSQIRRDCINGSQIGKEIKTYQVIETTWNTWKEMYPHTTVVSKSTGYGRAYGNYPYGSYRTSNQLIFPVNNTDDRLPKKERVLAVFVEDDVKVYSIELFEEPRVINDTLAERRIIITGDKTKNYIVSFFVDDDETEYELVNEMLPVVLKDEDENTYDVFGRSTMHDNEMLQPTNSFMGFFFAIAAFYPEVEIYE